MVQMLLFFVLACITHSLVERLSVLCVTWLYRQKPWECRTVTVKIYKCRLQGPHSQRNILKEEITSQKELLKVKKNVTAKNKRPLLLFCFTDFEQVFVAGFGYFFPWLIINHKHKCIQAKTFETQVSWSLDSCTH